MYRDLFPPPHWGTWNLPAFTAESDSASRPPQPGLPAPTFSACPAAALWARALLPVLHPTPAACAAVPPALPTGSPRLPASGDR